jgi:simple sugar transport system substrate-binding protein/basic membrane protein A
MSAPWRQLKPAIALLAAGLAVSACSSAPNLTSAGSSGGTKTTVGFIMVGSRADYGYNEAVYSASQRVAKSMPGVKVITADNIPENSSVTQTMLAMVSQGTKVIFATSYGYYQYARRFAEEHPDVIVLHQGGYDSGTLPRNFGTYFGATYQPVFLGGMAAGAATLTNKLGFVYAFPIPQTIANINAFELGAQLTNPRARTFLVNTSSWCNPLKQKQAASALLSRGADVLSQHQDCQATVIQAAKSAAAKVVGYHYNAKALDPRGWLTGSAWSWSPLYEQIVRTAVSGKFTGSRFNANFQGTFANKSNPLILAPFGKSVPASVRARILAKEAALMQPGASVFKGPISCQDGGVLYAKGVTPTDAQINQIPCLVKGVVGTLPSPS